MEGLWWLLRYKRGVSALLLKSKGDNEKVGGVSMKKRSSPKEILLLMVMVEMLASGEGEDGGMSKRFSMLSTFSTSNEGMSDEVDVSAGVTKEVGVDIGRLVGINGGSC